jgi:hypothetical protein
VNDTQNNSSLSSLIDSKTSPHDLTCFSFFSSPSSAHRYINQDMVSVGGDTGFVTF